MKLKYKYLIKAFSLIYFTILNLNNIEAAAVTSAASGNWGTATTWNIVIARPGTITATTSSKIVTGTTLASFTTTLSVGSQILNTSNVVIGVVASIESATSLTLVANASAAMTNAGWNSRGIGSGDDVTIASGHTITVDNNFTCKTLTFATAVANNILNFSGTSALTVTGLVSMPNPNASRSSVINVNGGTLTCGSLTTSGSLATRFTNINITTGTLDIDGTYTSSNAAGATINISSTGSVFFGGAVSSLFTLTPGTSSTIVYDMLSAQTVRPVAYNNLTIAGSGSKTTTTVSVNGYLTISGSATLSTAITYGASSGIIYNTTTSRSVSNNEWPVTFAGTKGVTIMNTGIILLNSAKVLSDNTSINLNINEGATLNTGNFGITFNGDFVNSGTLVAGSSAFNISNTKTTQSIGPISTSGTITVNKSGGTAQFTGNISAGTLTTTTSGGTLNLGSYTHTIGVLTITNGTLDASSSNTTVTGNITITSPGVFNASTSTIILNNSITQTSNIGTYYNLILSGTNTKTTSSGTVNINNDLTIKDNVTYNGSTILNVSGNISVEGTSTFSLGGMSLLLAGNLTIGNGSAATFNITSNTGGKNIDGNFTISTNAIFNNSGNEGVQIGGDFIIQGSATIGTGKYVLNGTSNIISSNSPIQIPDLTINGVYTNNTSLTVSTNLSGTGTLINNTNSALTITTNTISLTTLDASTYINTVKYDMAGAQFIINTNYYNLDLAGSDIKTFQSNTSTILGTFTISGSASTSFARGITINGNLNVSSGGNFIAGNFTHSINGNISIASGGTATWTGSTINLIGSKQSYSDLNTTKNQLNNLTLSGNGLKTINAESFLGNIIINDNDSLLLNGDRLTVYGTTTIGNGKSGYLNLQNASNTKIFKSNFTINSKALFDNAHTNVEFADNLIANGSFYAGGGTYFFTGTNKTISGSTDISLINLTINGTITMNSASLNINGILTGTGKLINTSTLFISSSSVITINQLNASSFSNTVHYNGDNQNIFGTNYYNLSLSGSGTKNMSNSMDSVYGNLIISNSITFNPTDNLVIIGNLSTASGSIVSLGNYTYTIRGDISIGNGTTYDFSNASFVFNGTNQNISNNTSTTLSLFSVTLIGGQKTFVNNVIFKGVLNINSDATLLIGATSTMTFQCTFSGTGKIAGTSCSNLLNRNLSFELASANMGTVYIDQTLNVFGRIFIKNNATVSIMNDIQIFEYLDLNWGKITINNTLSFSSSNIPIYRTSGFLDMTSNSSLVFGGCNNLGTNFTIPTNTFITPPTLVNFTINRANGISLGTNNISVSGSLNITSGSLAVSFGSLRLLSTSSKTARVSTISGTSNVTGTVTVDRFIPGGSNKRKWRFLSAPVNIGGSNALLQYIDDIFVTAPAGTAGGFDNSPQNNASIRTYNESTSGAASLGWTNPTNINNVVYSGSGVEVFVRGSRSLANPYLNWTVPDDVIIDYNGTLNVGTFDVGLSYTNTGNPSADGFNLVGNPYASPINFDTTGWTKTNMQNKFWSYNPNTGAYGVYDADLNTGTNSITQYIASGQGFFVKATATSSKITFTENVKCINSGNNYFKTNESQSTYPMIKIGISNDSTYTDETIVVLDENATALSNDEHDANKWFSDALNIYTLSSDNINLNIDARKTPSHIDSINLAVFSYNGADVMTTSHTIDVNGLSSLPSNIDAVLWDKFLNTYTNLKVNSRYEFMITTDKNSYGKDRFVILLGDVNIGIPDNYNNSVLKVFPNPSNGDLYLNTSEEWKGKAIKYSIIDQSGRTIVSSNTTIIDLNTPIDISSISDGFYILEIISENKANKIKFTKRQ